MPTLGKTKVSPSLISTGSTFQGTSSYAITASYAMNGGSGGSGGAVQTGSIANQTVLYNVTTSQDNVITGLNLSSNKWGVTVVEEWNSGSIVGDDYYPSCSLLMHFSGSNGSTTTFIDNSPNNLTATSNNGASISTVQSKFGGSSLLLDGTNDYLSVANSTVFDLTGDYTIEFWAYSSNFGAGGYLHRAFYSTGGLGWTGGMSFSIRGIGGIRFYFYATTNANEQYIDVAAPSSNTWHHFAMVKSGTTGRVFIDGTLAGTITSLNTPATNTQTLRIGVWDYSAGAEYFNGYIDEIRITKGYARYTGSFVTQSAEFPNNLNVTQLQTKYIGLVGGLNDSTVDYGVEKLSDSSLKIRKMTATGQPLSGSGSTLSASVDRVYVNVIDYTNVMVTSSYALTASYVLGGIQTGSISNQTILYNVTTSQENTITGLDLSGNKWDVSVIEEWNSASVIGDQYYNSCSLLLHFNGSNGSTVFVDNSPVTKSVTSNNGAAISTAQSKFGGASVYFDGTNDYLSIANNSAFDLSSGDFTVEFWFRTSTLSLPSSHAVLVGQMSYTSAGWGIWQYSSTTVYVYIGTGFAIQTPSVFTSTSTWYHIALVKNGTGANSLKLYVDGTVQAQGNYTPTYASSYPLLIGGITTATGWNNDFYSNGYIDELRITKGIARYTGSFTPSTSEFPNNIDSTQLQTKYIGLVGGLNDSTVDYGIEKLSDSSLKIRKMTASGQPLSGSGTLSASVDRVYVNVIDYTNVMVTSSYALTASYVLGGIQTGSISNQTILYNVTTSQENTITGLDLSGNKWDVSVIEEWDAKSITGGDEYYPSCSLLMHFSGSNGSTTFIDNSPITKSFTVNGNSQISTAQSKFGESSAYFDGTGDYLSTNSSNDFAFGTGDFTVEFWIYSSDVSSATQRGFLQTSDTSGGLKTSYTSGIIINQGANNVGSSLNGGISVNIAGTNIGSSTAVITTNTWYHIALVRNSGTSTLYVNGTSVGSGTTTGNCSGTYLSIGGYYNTSYLYQGYLDELRITKGIARYTGSFTTQSIEFPNTQFLTQLQTKYVGLIGGLNDTGSDYGVQKLSDSSLKIRKMTISGQPLSGSGALSASVDRVYVNVLNYKNVQTTVESASYASTSSYVINAPSGESFHPFLLG